MFPSRTPVVQGGGGSDLDWKQPLTSKDSGSVVHDLLVVNDSDELDVNSDGLPAKVHGRLAFPDTAPGSGLVVPIYTSSQRNALTAKTGLVFFNLTTSKFQGCVADDGQYVNIGEVFALPYSQSFVVTRLNSSSNDFFVAGDDTGTPTVSLNVGRDRMDVSGPWYFDATGNHDPFVLPRDAAVTWAAATNVAGRVGFDSDLKALRYFDGSARFRLLGDVTGSGNVEHLVLFAGAVTTVDATPVVAAAGTYAGAEHRLEPVAHRTLRLRFVAKGSTEGTAVRVSLWNVADAAAVTDLDGAGHAYVEVTGNVWVTGLSKELNGVEAGHFSATGTGMYEVRLTCPTGAATATLGFAELVVHST